MRRIRDRADRCRSAKRVHRLALDWLQPSLAGERRWQMRAPLHLEAQLRPRGRRRFPVRVTDLSAQGCRVEGAGPLVTGTYGWILLPTIESWYVRIAWADEAAAGLDFAAPLHPAVADLLVARGEQA